jgi:hypothetical protein
MTNIIKNALLAEKLGVFREEYETRFGFGSTPSIAVTYEAPGLTMKYNLIVAETPHVFIPASGPRDEL